MTFHHSDDIPPPECCEAADYHEYRSELSEMPGWVLAFFGVTLLGTVTAGLWLDAANRWLGRIG